MAGIVLDFRDTAINKTDKTLCFHESKFYLWSNLIKKKNIQFISRLYAPKGEKKKIKQVVGEVGNTRDGQIIFIM